MFCWNYMLPCSNQPAVSFSIAISCSNYRDLHANVERYVSPLLYLTIAVLEQS